MAYNAKKTEHAGPKKSRGAFYGPKAEAKKASKRRRRQNDKREAVNYGTSQAQATKESPGRLSALQAVENDRLYPGQGGRRALL